MFAEVNSSLSSQQDTNKFATYAIHILTAIIVVIATSLFYTYQYSIHHDLAGGILSGKFAIELGDIYDKHAIYFPPAEKLWFSIAARIHTFIGIELDIIIVTMTALAILLSAQFAYFIRKQTTGGTYLFLFASIAALSIIPILFKNVFGLREHFVALGFWPYLVYRFSDPRGKLLSLKWRIVLGIWLGWTLLFKYLFAIVILFIELTDVIVQRRMSILFRIENLISGIVVVSYLFTWLILNPENLQVIGIMRNAIEANLIDLQNTAKKIGFKLFYIIPILATGFFYKSDSRKLFISVALLIGTITVAAIQARWYSHHQFPIFMANIVLLWIIGRKTNKIAITFFCLLLSTILYDQFTKSSLNQTRFKMLEQSFFENNISLDDKRVVLLIAHPSPFNEIVAVEGGTRWSDLVNFSYVFSELAEYDIMENEGKLAPPIESFNEGREILHAKTLSLWEDFPPDVIIMDHSKSWPLKHLKINWPHLFSKDDRFSHIMEKYTLAYSHKDSLLTYDYYIKK